MSENEKVGTPDKKKVKRNRRRLYESVPNEEDAAADEPQKEREAAADEPQKESAAGGGDETEVGASGGVHDKAKKIIKNHAIMSMAPALIPMPLLDMAVSAGIQLRMMKKLSDCYNVAFSRQKAKAFAGALIGGYHVGLFALSVMKLAPVIGTVGGVATLAVLSPATTYAVGVVFRKHFESGGTFLDFSASKAREDFRKEVKEGEKIASGVTG